MEKLRIRLLQGTYAVCQIKDTENILNCFDEKDFFLLQKQKMKFLLLCCRIKFQVM